MHTCVVWTVFEEVIGDDCGSDVVGDVVVKMVCEKLEGRIGGDVERVDFGHAVDVGFLEDSEDKDGVSDDITTRVGQRD